MAKRGLGKGLGALIPTEDASSTGNERPPASTPKQARTEVVESTPAQSASLATNQSATDQGAVYAEIPVDALQANPRQPRTVFDEESLAELTFSITEIGLLQPVVVRRTADGYELIAGERRLRACQEAGMSTIPAIIRTTDDTEMLREALLENLHRADLNPLEEAAAYSQMLADFGCTQEELATRIGRSRPQVTNTLRLLKLPTSVQTKVAAGVISAGHARALLSLDSPEQMEAMAQRIVSEGLSVRSVEELVLVGDPSKEDKKRQRRERSKRSDELEDLVSELTSRVADQLDTRVSVSGLGRKNSKGALVIECADAEDLRRIVDIID
ncbi:MAG: chromosome partitioning protein ParB [Micrococcales bacterium]|nr:chromosome partitioning protein ParB [Micrococcales bacterium]MAK40051.1 chromosome partitioning protein ParB [Micrococcales bacterium]